MAPPYLITRIGQDQILLVKSRKYSIIAAGGSVIFLSLWYGGLLAAKQRPWEKVGAEGFSDWYMLIFWLAPLALLIKMLPDFKNALVPRTLVFDAVLKRVTDAERPSISFEAVQSVEIKTVKDSDGPDKNHLALRLKGSGKLRLEVFENYDEAFALADELAEFLKVPLSKSGG